MTLLTEKQARKLLSVVATAAPDSLQCDECFQLQSEYADAELTGIEVAEKLYRVRQHFDQCPCCAYEYGALIEAIRAASAEGSD